MTEVFDKLKNKKAGKLSDKQIAVLKERGLWGSRYVEKSSIPAPDELKSSKKSDSKS